MGLVKNKSGGLFRPSDFSFLVIEMPFHDLPIFHVTVCKITSIQAFQVLLDDHFRK